MSAQPAPSLDAFLADREAVTSGISAWMAQHLDLAAQVEDHLEKGTPYLSMYTWLRTYHQFPFTSRRNFQDWCERTMVKKGIARAKSG